MIPAVVLAAGRSSRMGRPKALLPAGDGDTFLTRIVRTFVAAGVTRVIVVLGHDADTLRAALAAAGLAPEVVINPRYDDGQLSSLLTGLDAVEGIRPPVMSPDAAAPPETAEAMLLMLVDAPFVSAETITAVVDRYRETGAPVVRPVRGDVHGHPVLIDRRLFPLLRSADPARGAKPIVRAHVSPAGDVAVDDDGAFMDIDTPDEFVRVTGGAERPALGGGRRRDG